MIRDAYPSRGRRARETDLDRSDTYAACGECPKGKCDGCDMCDYFVALAARYGRPEPRSPVRLRLGIRSQP